MDSITRTNCLYIKFFIFHFLYIRNEKGRWEAFVSLISPIFAVSSGERSVWTFTLRDSEEDFINVTVWGSTEFVKKLSSMFNIGSVGA